jgi:hypothetical protein
MYLCRLLCVRSSLRTLAVTCLSWFTSRMASRWLKVQLLSKLAVSASPKLVSSPWSTLLKERRSKSRVAFAEMVRPSSKPSLPSCIAAVSPTTRTPLRLRRNLTTLFPLKLALRPVPRNRSHGLAGKMNHHLFSLAPLSFSVFNLLRSSRTAVFAAMFLFPVMSLFATN